MTQSSTPAGDEEVIRIVLERFGMAAAWVRDVEAGQVNRTWRAGVAGREYALRRYESPKYLPRTRSVESIRFEHAALAHAAAKGWPVAEAVASQDGDTMVEAEGETYALFPWLPGREAPPHNLRYLRIKGRLLSRLHRDMAGFGQGEQRPGFARMWELDGAYGSERTLNELLYELADTHNAAAWTVRRQRYGNLRELSRLGYGELPDTFVHWDFHHDNLLFQGGELTGLLDFDSCHVDARVADIAQSIALDCIEPPTYNAIDPDATRAFVAGYLEGSLLSDQEMALIVPLLRSWIVAAAAGRIAQWSASGRKDERALGKLMRTVEGRIPAFEHRRVQLELAVQEAATEVQE